MTAAEKWAQISTVLAGLAATGLMLAAVVVLCVGPDAQAAGKGKPRPQHVITVINGGKVMKTYTVHGKIDRWHQGVRFTTVKGDTIHLYGPFVMEPYKVKTGWRKR